MKYIDAERLRAEIEKRKQVHFDDYFIKKSGNSADYGASNALANVISLIDSLQQEQSEVDLEKEVSKWWDASFQEPDFKFRKHQAHIVSNNEIIKLAKHFYELGINARKE